MCTHLCIAACHCQFHDMLLMNSTILFIVVGFLAQTMYFRTTHRKQNLLVSDQATDKANQLHLCVQCILKRVIR